ncbi:MAG: TetR/AcrR family transcriptional regulator [bacterium]
MALFRQQGVAATTVEQITRAAGVAKGTFFNHFPSKESLLSSFVRYETNSMIAQVISRDLTDARKTLRLIAEGLARLGTENVDLMLPFADLKGGDPELKEQEREHDDEVRQTLSKLLENDPDVEEKWCREHGSRFVEVVLATWAGTIHEWRLTGGSLNLRKALLDRLELLLQLLP